MSLADFGWNDALATAFAPHAAAGLEPARVVCELRRKFCAVQTATDEVLGECRGGFFHQARTAEQFPAVGDWVGVKRREGTGRADIHALLPRRTKFSRRASGSEEIEQIIAANIDTVFLVSGLDQPPNPARIQRFLVAARESGAEPVILLNKSDVASDADEARRAIEIQVPGVPVLVTSGVTRKGIKAVTTAYALPGRTLAFIGSSGVGKSSLINAIVRDPDALPTGEVREKDRKGRHTTTRRELLRTPGGALIIDTPGMRELQIWGREDGVGEAFADLVALAARCRFSNCTHRSEPGCAVRLALEDGSLSESRLESYRKLRAERAARVPIHRKPGAFASKPGWRNRNQGEQPFRHRQHADE